MGVSVRRMFAARRLVRVPGGRAFLPTPRFVCTSQPLFFRGRESKASRIQPRASEEVFLRLKSSSSASEALQIIQEKGHERDLYHAALMNQNDVAWNSHTYNLLLTACAKRKDTRMAARYFEMMRKEQLAPDAQIYATMITLLARNGRAKEAWQLLQQSCQGEEVRSEWR